MRAVRSCSVRLLPLALPPCLCLCLALCLTLCPALLPSPASAEPGTPDAAGMVLSFTPEAWAESGADAARTPLALKMPLAASQAVLTGPTGKAQLLFEDDSTVSVAPDSRVDIKDFAFTPTQSRFELGLNNGLVRVVSGEIVRRNPGGFAVRTPEAHVGVRGTTFSVARWEGRTTAVLLETSGTGLEVTNLSTGLTTRLSQVGYALEVTPGQTLQRRATPAEMNAARQAARRDGAPTAPVQTAGAPPNLSPQGGKSPAGAADRDALVVGSVAAAPLAGPGLNVNDINGSFAASGITSWNGDDGKSWDAGFTVSLGTAAISNASLNVLDGGSPLFEGSGGTGSINADGSFNVGGINQSGSTDFTANMNGQFSSTSGGNLNWDARYNIDDASIATGSGAFSKQ